MVPLGEWVFSMRAQHAAAGCMYNTKIPKVEIQNMSKYTSHKDIKCKIQTVCELVGFQDEGPAGSMRGPAVALEAAAS